MSDKLFGLSGTVSPNFLAVIFLNFGPELHACEVAEGVLHGSRTYLLQSPDGPLLSGLLI